MLPACQNSSASRLASATVCVLCSCKMSNDKCDRQQFPSQESPLAQDPAKQPKMLQPAACLKLRPKPERLR